MVERAGNEGAAGPGRGGQFSLSREGLPKKKDAQVKTIAAVHPLFRHTRAHAHTRSQHPACITSPVDRGRRRLTLRRRTEHRSMKTCTGVSVSRCVWRGREGGREGGPLEARRGEARRERATTPERTGYTYGAAFRECTVFQTQSSIHPQRRASEWSDVCVRVNVSGGETEQDGTRAATRRAMGTHT